ncbi:protein NO VEIN domain-containing protein [Pseudarthrobacter sp. So.54]
MSMPRTVIVAIGRWLDLLSKTGFVRANAIVHNDAAYTDITPTQYATALEWLWRITDIRGLVELAKDSGTRRIPLDFSRRVALQSLIIEESPSWLSVADQLVATPDDLPTDVVEWGASLGMTDEDCLDSVRNVSRKVNLQARSDFGAAGESALLALLETAWPGSATHISTISDGFGYDISFQESGIEWHLEVKSVAAGPRARIFLTRHEFEVARRDPAWRLVILSMDHDWSVLSVCVADSEKLMMRSPRDVATSATWETCRFVLSAEEASLPFCRALGIETPKSASVALWGSPGLPVATA